MVENGKFLKRLRNGHLEKSVATGICRVRRSPKTAKTPRKVHLRLRFQNLGKPRTAGLCGRAAGACDCGPLSCTKIERPSPLEKLSCKVRLFANRRSHKYRQKVTATTLSQTAFHRVFSFSHKWPTFAFTSESGYTLGFQRKIAHKGTHGETGAFPPSSTAWSCAAGDIPFIPPRFYIHTFPGSLWTTTISNSSISDYLSLRFSTPRTNAPRLPSLPKAGTHSAFGERSHTRAYTAKQGSFRMGVVSLPSDRSERSRIFPGRVSERRTLPLLGLGRVYSRRTQRAFGTAMCLCASRPRWAA